METATSSSSGGGWGSFAMGLLLGCGATAWFFINSTSEMKEKKKSFLETIAHKRGGAGSYAAASSVERTGAFLTDLLSALWKHFDVAVSRAIVESVEPMFKDMLPGPLASLRFTKVSLGRVPLRLDNAVVHTCAKTSTGKDYIQMEVDAVWDGDCDIRLKADYLGSFGVKSMKLAGRMSFIFQPIVYDLSLIGGIQYGFINVPELDLEFTGLANVGDLKGIKTSIKQTLLDIIAGMMVLPMRMLTKMDDALPYFDMYHPPVGVARVTIQKARGFRVEKRKLRKSDVPDVFCQLLVGGKKVFQTTVVKDNLSPVWNQSGDFVLDDHDQVLTFRFFDEDLGTMDASNDDLGTARITVGELLLAGKTQELEIQDEDGKRTGAYGTVHCDILGLVSDLASIKECQKSDNAEDNTCGGLLTILVSQAFDVFIPEDKKDDETYCFFVKIVCGEETFWTSAVAGKDPSFDCYYRVPITSKTGEPSMKFFLFQGPEASDSEKNSCIGNFDIPFNLLAHSPNGKLEGRKIKIGGSDASLEYSVSLSGVKKPDPIKNALEVVTDGMRDLGRDMKISSPHMMTPTAETGPVVHVTVVEGWGFQIQKRRLKKADVPDCYCNIRYGSSPTIWRTATIKDSCEPVWNETRAFRLLDHGQILDVECLDEDSGPNDPDDPQGKARVSIGKVLLAGGSMDVELQESGKPNGCYITIKAFVEQPPAEGTATEAAQKNVTATTLGGGTSGDEADKDKGIEIKSGFAGALDAVPDTKPSAYPKAILVTAVQGSGFKVQKRRLRKNDVPDIFLKVKIGASNNWTTATIKDDVEPAWNESYRFVNIQADDLVSVDAFDADSKGPDEYLGSASIPVTKLLTTGECQLELKAAGAPTGATVTIRAAEA